MLALDKMRRELAEQDAETAFSAPTSTVDQYIPDDGCARCGASIAWLADEEIPTDANDCICDACAWQELQTLRQEASRHGSHDGDGSQAVASVGEGGHGDALRGRSQLDPAGSAGAASGGRGAGVRTAAKDAGEGGSRSGPATISAFERIAESLDADVFDMSAEEIDAELREAGADPVAVGDMGRAAAFLGKMVRFGWPGEMQHRELQALLAEVRQDERQRRPTATVSVDPRIAEVVSAATALREAEHKPTRAMHAAFIRLYNALDALPTLEACRESLTAEPEPQPEAGNPMLWPCACGRQQGRCPCFKAGAEAVNRNIRGSTTSLFCSFCGKSRREIKKMVAAQDRPAIICDECVDQCVEKMRPRSEEDLPCIYGCGASMHNYVCEPMKREQPHPEGCDCCSCDEPELHKLRNCSACASADELPPVMAFVPQPKSWRTGNDLMGGGIIKPHEETPQRLIRELLEAGGEKCVVCHGVATRHGVFSALLLTERPRHFCDEHSYKDIPRFENASATYTDVFHVQLIRRAKKWLNENRVEEKC